jgi:hypothetical protein
MIIPLRIRLIDFVDRRRRLKQLYFTVKNFVPTMVEEQATPWLVLLSYSRRH